MKMPGLNKLIKDLNPKKRFLLILVTVYVISLPVISIISYGILKNNAVEDAYSKGKLYLLTMMTVRGYVIEELRPLLFKELPGRFIREGMSGAYVARRVADKVQEKQYGYKFKLASLDPRNPVNIADEFEKEIISSFIADRTLKEWSGLRTKADGKYYIIARPGEPFGEQCLYCHSSPDAAPQEVVEKYGSKAGFNRKAGDLLDAKFVYIPVDVPLAGAQQAVTIFIAVYTVFFSVIFLIINARFTGLYNRMESDKHKIDTLNSDLTDLNEGLETIVAERTMGIMALTVADRVRNPASVIGWTCKRMIEKEQVPDKLSGYLKDIIEETSKLESIVKNFEVFLKSKQAMFVYEDLNDIVKNAVSVIEKEARENDIDILLNLAEQPLKINAHKNLLRTAILYIMRNSIEATPPKGSIKIETSKDIDNVIITITDTGTGIPEESIDKIFDPFFSTKAHGYGMGLALVKQIVSEHLGSIKAESKGGQGTTFRLKFPVRWKQQ